MLPRKKKVVILLHLCFAFAYLFWLLAKPYSMEIMSQKSKKTLYSMVMEREALFTTLPVEDQTLLAEGQKNIPKKKFTFLLSETLYQFFVKTPAFALAWLFFSLLLCFLLLWQIEGASLATWILPLLILGYAYFLYTAPKEVGSSLFPSENYVLETYVNKSEQELANYHDNLLMGWHRYLVVEWGKESPSAEPELFKQQVDRSLFYFNVARLKWILTGKGDEIILAGFATPPSFLRLACYFIWNLMFAWWINQKRDRKFYGAPSPQNS